MKKAILIVVSDGFGGYGDFLFALKLSQQIKKQFSDAGDDAPPVHIITQPSGKTKIIGLKGDVEFNVSVMTPSQLATKVQNNDIDIGHIVEAPVFNSQLIDAVDNALSLVPRPIPLLMIPEYGYSSPSSRAGIRKHEIYRKHYLPHIKYQQTLYSGFNESAMERGILLSDELTTPPPKAQLVAKLDEKIRDILTIQDNPEAYHLNTELFMQYSHDTYTNTSPALHFLNIHREFVKGSTKNQDLVMVGKSLEHKEKALAQIQNELIKDGFTRISFYNAEDKTERVLYDSGTPGSTYRVIYAAGMSHESMIACAALSAPLTGATGDQSLSEALSGNRIMVYECLAHKNTLIKNYDSAIIKESGHDPQIVELLYLLREAGSKTEYQRLGVLLREPANQLKLATLNKSLMIKYDFVAQIVRDGLGWEMAIKKRIVHLLQNDQQLEALSLFKKHPDKINILDTHEDKTLFDYVHEHYSAGAFIDYLNNHERIIAQCFALKNEEEAINFLNEKGILPSPFTQIAGKTFFEHALDAKYYGYVANTIQHINSETDKTTLHEILHKRSPIGETYLAQLRRERPAAQHPATAIANYTSILNSLAQYQPKPRTKRAQMHGSFMELVKTFEDTSLKYDEKALIGLLLLNKKNIESEYKFFSPRKGLFFGSALYSICEDALHDLGVDLKTISAEQERGYYQALATVINQKPEFLANEYILQSLGKQAGIGFPHIHPMLSQVNATALLTGKKSVSSDNSILPAAGGGFYKLAPQKLGQGAWGSVYAARHYSLEGEQVKISPPLAVKQMPYANRSSLAKEHQHFKAAYPDEHFERVEHQGKSYLVMPLFPGITLSKYLSSHTHLLLPERIKIAQHVLVQLDELHKKGLTHNDLKPANMLIEPINQRVHIIDFGCAEPRGTAIKYNDIYTSVFAFEMPPEYMRGTQTKAQLDIFSVTPIIAEILGLDKYHLVEARMTRAFSTIDNPRLKKDIIAAFQNTNNLGDAFFHSQLLQHEKNPELQRFIDNYVAEPYDFSPYATQLGPELTGMLNAMQSSNPETRPALEQCIELLHNLVPVSVHNEHVVPSIKERLRSIAAAEAEPYVPVDPHNRL